MFFRNAVSLLSLSLAANAQLAGQTVFYKTVLTAGNGNCLTATSNADGAPVVIQDCGTNATQLNSWVVPNGESNVGPLQIFGDKCLDVTNGVDADGTLLQIWTCFEDNTNQMWIPINDQSITWSGQDKCVDLTNGNLTNGNQVQIWDCTAGDDNQKWNAIAIDEPTSFTIALKENPSLCVTASANVSGAPVVIDECQPGSAAQNFTDPTQTGQIVAFDNLCVTPNGNINDGTPLILSPCISGNAAQEWNHDSTSTLVDTQANLKICLDLTNGNQTAGNQLQIWTCTILTSNIDNTNQDWIVTEAF